MTIIVNIFTIIFTGHTARCIVVGSILCDRFEDAVATDACLEMIINTLAAAATAAAVHNWTSITGATVVVVMVVVAVVVVVVVVTAATATAEGHLISRR